MGGCQNYGHLLGPLHTRCGIILRTQKVTILLTTTHVHLTKIFPGSSFHVARAVGLGYLEAPGR